MRISDWSSDVCSSDLLGLSDPELDLLLAYSQLGQQEFDAVVSGIDEELKADSALERDLFVARGAALLGLGRFDAAGIGRASCRERVCQAVLLSVVAG